MQTSIRLACSDRLGQILTSHPFFESRVKNRARLGVDDVPRLGFSEIRSRHPQAIGVIGMDLDTQYILAIQVLEQQRKAVEVGGP